MFQKFKKIFVCIMLLVFLSNFFGVAIVQAQSLYDRIKSEQFTKIRNIGLPGSDSDESTDTVLNAVMDTIKYTMGLLVIIFIILIIYAGFKWMTAAGNEETIGKAKKIIGSAIIGLVVVLMSYVITVFIFDVILTNSTTYF